MSDNGRPPCDLCDRIATQVTRDTREGEPEGRWRMWVVTATHYRCDEHPRRPLQAYADGRVEHGDEPFFDHLDDWFEVSEADRRAVLSRWLREKEVEALGRFLRSASGSGNACASSPTGTG